MYYVFKSILVQWQGINLHAAIQRDILGPIDIDWWSSEPLQSSVPEFVFTVCAGAPLLDNYYTGTEFALYSERLVAIMADLGVRYEVFPATLTDHKTGETLSCKYKVFRLLETHAAVDKAKSVYRIRQFGTESVPLIDKLVLSPSFLEKNIPLTRIQEHYSMILMHKDIKTVLDKAEITGCLYTPVEDFSHRIMGRFI